MGSCGTYSSFLVAPVKLRQHTKDVHKTIDQLVKTLQLQPDKVQWGHMLDQFSVANIQLAKMKQQLRPLLKSYAVHPKMLTQSNADGAWDMVDGHLLQGGLLRLSFLSIVQSDRLLEEFSVSSSSQTYCQNQKHGIQG